MGYVLRSIEDNPMAPKMSFFNTQGELEFALKNLPSATKEIDMWLDQDPEPPITTDDTIIGDYTPIHNGHRVLNITNHGDSQ